MNSIGEREKWEETCALSEQMIIAPISSEDKQRIEERFSQLS